MLTLMTTAAQFGWSSLRTTPPVLVEYFIGDGSAIKYTNSSGLKRKRRSSEAPPAQLQKPTAPSARQLSNRLQGQIELAQVGTPPIFMDALEPCPRALSVVQPSPFLDIDNSWTQMDPHQRAAVGLNTAGHEHITRFGLHRRHVNWPR
jgi:hypothetical protein